MPEERRTITHGSDGDLLYVDDATRKCAKCDKIKFLSSFSFSKQNNGTRTIVSLECRECVDAMTQLAIQKREAEATELFVKTIAKATGRRTLMDAAPKGSDGVRHIMRGFKGQRKFWGTVQRTIARGLEAKDQDGRDDLTLQVKTASTMIDFVLRAEKNAGPPVDISELSEEDRMMVLMAPARKLLLESPAFRRELLNDPQVRRMLTNELGVDVLEVSAADPMDP